MLIRILEDGPDLKKGVVNVTPEIAMSLISQGIAIKVSENALDKQAHANLNDAKARDSQQNTD